MAFSKRTTGITNKTANNLVIDAGAVYLNYGEEDERLLGATSGGSSFLIETEVREPEIDGARSSLRGVRRVTKVSAKITCSLMELTTENLLLALAGSDKADFTQEGGGTTTHESITRSRNITAGDYVKNMALVGKVNNNTENFIGIIYNAITEGGLEIKTEDGNEATIELEFSASIDPGEIGDDGSFKEPWEIRFPKSATPPAQTPPAETFKVQEEKKTK